MPELPEVETTKLGLAPLIIHQSITQVILHRSNLRWEIPKHLVSTLAHARVEDINRRGKYLLIEFSVGTLIIHLGMSGSIRMVDVSTALQKHDHFELQFNNQQSMRLNDPRRFGCVLFSTDGTHPLLDKLGVEPLDSDFDDTYLYTKSRNKQQNIKTFIMNSKVVVGVGNIYACESLFKAGIDPKRLAGDISNKRYKLLTLHIKAILSQAIKAGGTTLQNFSKVDGSPGYFAQTLLVYGRENQPCGHCGGKIMRIIQNQRSTFYCKQCQT